MNNRNNLPLDQESQKKRESARETLSVLKTAGGNLDIVVVVSHDAREFKRIIEALNDLEIFWCEVDGEIYVNRHDITNLLTY